MRRLSPLALASLITAGCGQESDASDASQPPVTPPPPGSFTDHTATVLIGAEGLRFTVDSCGLEGEAFHVTGTATTGATFEAVVETDDDGVTGVADASGLFVSGYREHDWSAFGEDAWEQRDKGGDAPGEVTSSRVNGPLVQIVGEISSVDGDEQETDEKDSFSLDAFCDEEI